MFYKIIKNNTVIDVNNVFLHENPKNHILTETTYEHVHFIVSSNGQNLYKTKWCGGIENSVYHVETIQAELINEAEFLTLKEQLMNTVIEYTETKNNVVEIVNNEVKDEVKVLDTIEMKRRILELEELVKELLNK